MMNSNTILMAVQAQLDGIAKSIINAADIEHISSVQVTDTIAYFGTGYRSDVMVPVSVTADIRVIASTIQIMLIVKVSPAGGAEEEKRTWWLLTDRGDEQKEAVETARAFLASWCGERKAA